MRRGLGVGRIVSFFPFPFFFLVVDNGKLIFCLRAIRVTLASKRELLARLTSGITTELSCLLAVRYLIPIYLP